MTATSAQVLRGCSEKSTEHLRVQPKGGRCSGAPSPYGEHRHPGALGRCSAGAPNIPPTRKEVMANYADDSPLSISLAPNLGSVELTDREDGQTITLPIIGYAVVVRFSYLNNRSDCAAVCADETSISPVVIDQSGQPVVMSQLISREPNWSWTVNRSIERKVK